MQEMEMNQNQINEAQEEKLSIIDRFALVVKSENDFLEDRLFNGLKSKQDAILKKLNSIEDKIDILNKYVKGLNNEVDINELVKILEGSGFNIKRN